MGIKLIKDNGAGGTGAQADKPKVLVDIHQGRNFMLQSVRESAFGERGGVCEGLCAVWIKYASTDKEDAFITRMKKGKFDICKEIVGAQASFVNLKARHNQASGKIAGGAQAKSDSAMAEVRQYREFVEKHGLDAADPVELEKAFDRLTDDQRRKLEEFQATLRRAEQVANEGSEEAKVLAGLREEFWTRVRAIHGGHSGKPVMGCKGANLFNDLGAMLRDNGDRFLFLRLHQKNPPGHAIAFYAGTKKDDVAFLDPNTCLYQFSDIGSCAKWFAGYWTETYKQQYVSPDDHYDYEVAGLG